jgi:hypothetical protein
MPRAMVAADLSRFRWVFWMAAATVVFANTPEPRADTAAPKVIADLDLAKAFGARSAWRFVALQEPQAAEQMLTADYSPATVRFCLSKAGWDGCLSGVKAAPAASGWGAQYLNVAKVVYPHGGSAPPLLLLQSASNGIADQAVYTQLFAYRRTSDRFAQVYGHETGRNNNQEVRYITSGPLIGSIISAEPTDHRPYVYWVTVSRLSRAYVYRKVLRYRSATGYDDGNGLPVIDSELPSVEQRLGLWRPDKPIPLPSGGCLNPRLVHMELWCS